jgi:hypothetical protein
MANFPIAAGHPDLSGNYIPNLFAKKLLIEFYKSTVFGAIANTDYQGTISDMGDKVSIRTLPSITINTYTKGMDLTYEKLTPTNVDLLIDKGRYWAFPVNDVDLKQADIAYVNQWSAHAASSLKVNIDNGILSDIYTDVHASNKSASAGAISANVNIADVNVLNEDDTMVDLIVDCGDVLDQQNVPSEGRWFVLPSRAVAAIKKGTLKDASISGDSTSVMRNGKVGTIDRFTIYQSNNVYNDGTHDFALFGHPTALTFASQMAKVETLRNQNDFGSLVRGLQVYGYKVVKPEAIGYATIDYAA